MRYLLAEGTQPRNDPPEATGLSDPPGTMRSAKGVQMVQSEWFRAYVEKLLREAGDAEVFSDGDGDYPYRWGTAACWVRVVEEPQLRVQVFGHAASGVKATARLLRELNEVNANSVSARVHLSNGSVIVEQAVPADGLNAATLAQACIAVGSVADDLGMLLAAMFDGETPFPSEAHSIESEGA